MIGSEKKGGFLRLIEFFEDKNGKLSFTRLMIFLAYFPSSYILIGKYHDSSLDISFYSAYLGGFVVGFIGGKVAEGISGKEVT